jgi:hypothetical protein
MKKLLLNVVLALALVVSITSCRETKEGAEKAGDAVETAAEETAEATEGALEKAGKAMDNAVDETEEAAEATGDAVEEVVGDDN